MSTLLTDSTTTHPPDTGDRQILTIPDPDGRRRLALADRLSLSLGLWLLQRSLRAEERPAPRPPSWRPPAIDEHEALTLLTYDLQRRLL